MKVINIDKNIIQFEFPSETDLPDNITVLVSGNKGSIIDTSFPKNMKLVLEYLEKENIKLENIFISHYHQDHYSGLEGTPEKTLYGSREFKKTMNSFNWDIPDFIVPDKYFEDIGSVKWEEYQLDFIPVPGHSLCNTGLIINGKTIFVGDAVMKDIHGEVVIPYICIGDIQTAKDSIETIKKGNFDRLLLAHGKEIKGASNINNVLDRTITYLNELLCYKEKYSNGKEKFTAHEDFAFSYWHGLNLNNMK